MLFASCHTQYYLFRRAMLMLKMLLALLKPAQHPQQIHHGLVLVPAISAFDF
jgi:hypothetical protein